MQKVAGISSHRFAEQVESDYQSAAITLVYARNTSSNTRTLLFAAVELLPSWLESGEFDFSRGVGGGLEINVRRATVSTHEGFKWYLNCRTGAKPHVPITENDRKNGWATSPRTLEIPMLGEEPFFPNMVVTNNYFWDNGLIWGSYPGGYRWHQMRPLTAPNLTSLWPKSSQLDEARVWLLDRLSFDLFSRPLAIGSLHLICHNPIFRTVRYYPSTDDPTRMLVKFQPGPNKSVKGLIVHLREDRPSGPAVRQVFHMEESSAEVSFDHELHSVGLDVVCPTRGLIYHSESAPFIKSIAINMGIITKQRVVNLPRRSKTHGESQQVTSIVGIENSIHVGEKIELQTAISIIATERSRVENAKLGEKLGQRWFDNNQDAATNEIRSLISQAKSDILIVDPYFGHFDLLQFALAASDAKATIRILTSHEYLKGFDDKKTKGVRRSDLLFKQLESVRKQDSDLSGLQIRVMIGKRADVHDRFIKTPEMILHLGSSLNEFGTRGTMTMRIPNPYPVEEHLEAAWEKGLPLADYLARTENNE